MREGNGAGGRACERENTRMCQYACGVFVFVMQLKGNWSQRFTHDCVFYCTWLIESYLINLMTINIVIVLNDSSQQMLSIMVYSHIDVYKI